VDRNEQFVKDLASEIQRNDFSGIDNLMEFYATNAGRWSHNNIMGLYLQNPDLEKPVTIREVAKFGHTLKDCANKLSILVPITIKFDAQGNRIRKNGHREPAKPENTATIDSWLGTPANGADAREDRKEEDPEAEVEVAHTKRIFWPTACVVDLGTDTEGPPIDAGMDRHEEADALLQALTGYASDNGITVTDMKGTCVVGAAGLSTGEGRVAINSQLSPERQFGTLVHEIAHERVHPTDVRKQDVFDKKTRELHAEGISYVVCRHFGLTGRKSALYLQSHAVEPDQLMDHLKLIAKHAREIIRGVSSHLAIEESATRQSGTEAGEESATVDDFDIEDIDEIGASVKF
jgi:hypothetical protein